MPDRIGIREIVFRQRDRPVHARLDPSAFACSTLAGQLADLWVDYHRKNALKTVHAYPTAIRSFAKFLDVHLMSQGIDPTQARLEDESIDLPALIHAWGQSLLKQYPENSRRPWGLERALLALLSHGSERDLNVPERVRRRAAAPPGVRKATGQVLDEFSNAERAAMRKAAQDDVRALERRLARGLELLEAGRDPRRHGWLELPNLIWAARHGLVDSHTLNENLPLPRNWPADIREFAESSGIWPGIGLMGCLHHMLFPREIDLHPFRVLLLLGMTDCTSEELHALQVPDLEFSAEGVRIVQAKERAERIRADFHLAEPSDGTPEEPGDKSYPGRGAWDVPGLLRRLVKANTLTREVFDGEPWLFTAVESRKRVRMDAALAAFQDPGRRFTHWLERHSGPDRPFPKGVSRPHDVRRLRKTAKTTRVVALGGTLTDLAGDDHSVRVFQQHYAHGTTAHVLAGAAMNRAQSKVFAKVTGQATLVRPEDEARLAEPEVAAALGVTLEQGADLRDGQLDMGVSNCKDPHNSPHSTPGKLCHVAPAMCMICDNAVVFVSQLHQQLMLFDHIQHMRNVLPPKTWHSIWGRQEAALKQVFEECADHIEDARKTIEEQALTLNLPLGMRTEYDR
ncbi:hypothetical protein BFF78_36285 [Streptomyces fodineus]|uniref:Integrase n=1 Tax=Streptomyces fodineus TaxID=1904616 RepID=A0A1D7YJT0_9ACTN|nr:hypothetical protein [Streptomyces fodineus]AOR35804.1 hypothetical protein BFF78_36285 [Streptomyces fodineus]